MKETATHLSYTTFNGFRRIRSGSLLDNCLAAKHAQAHRAAGPLLTFDDQTGRTVDLDLRGSEKEITARVVAQEAAEKNRPSSLSAATETAPAVDAARGRGRPKLGVIAREVTLLPRHWDWLATQPGGASVALRKLVEEAKKARAGLDQTRAAHERAYHFMLAIAGDLPGYEEATRALFANDARKFRSLTSDWPADVRDHAIQLAYGTPSSATHRETEPKKPRVNS